jgi:enoyl-CoA hydratase
MTEGGVRVEKRGVALVATIDRPGARNAIARETAAQLEAFAEQASADVSVRAAIITGAGHEVFVAGGDLREFDAYCQQPMGVQQVLDMGSTMVALEDCAVPVVAAVQGAALGGGCELTLACDLVVAEEHATFSFRQAAMGLSTGWGGGTRLLERVGPMHAARLLLLGAKIGAAEAAQIGLVTQLSDQGKSLDEAIAWSDAIARLPRASVTGLKRMLRDVRREHRGKSLACEAQVFASLWGQPDHLAAMEAFRKR